MSIISRTFAASPARTAAEVWDRVVNIIADGEEQVKTELNSIAGIVASIISEETPKKNAITFIGTGPKLRIYCLYGDDAIGDDANEGALNWKLFENDWEVHFPVEEEDLDWVTNALKTKNNNFKTYKAGEKINDVNENSASNFSQLSINLEKI